LLLAVPGAAFAQGGGVLTYGSSATGAIDATAPLAIYSFAGTAGDFITAQATPITPGFGVALSLLSPTQQQLAANDNNFFSLGGSGASLSYILPETGTFFLMVSGVGATQGEFLISLDAQPPAVSSVLGEEAATLVNIPLGAPSQSFSFEGDPANPTTITVGTDTPDFGFTVRIIDPNGQVIALINGSSVQAISLTIAPGAGLYQVEVSSADPEMQGTIELGLGESSSTGSSGPASSGGSSSSEVCQIASNRTNSVNLRGGPGTNYDVIGSLDPGVYFDATGYYYAGSDLWYRIDYFGLYAWVASIVVNTTGPCDALSQVQPSSAGQPQYTPTPTYTYAPGQPTYTPTYTPTAAYTYAPGQSTYTPTATYTQQQQQAQYTATYTPTPTYTQQQAQYTATPSYTPTTEPAAQVAPPDANFNNPLNIPLDNTASVLDFVSYPGGDTEDRVRWDITGMNPNVALSGGRARLVISASCFGTGTEHIQFFTGGQTYSCGQTIVDREVTYDSRTGQVTITAVGGSDTYVQWVLTGTATRTN
jgi:uncharacterized protein YraI